MMRRILFVKTPATDFQTSQAVLKNKLSAEVPMPLGICYLASIFRERGYSVEIFDPHIKHVEEYTSTGDPELLREAIRRRLRNLDYDVVGIASQFLYTYRWGHFIAAESKAAAPHIPVIIGGGHPSLIGEKVIQDKNIDFVVMGEGEQTALSIIKYLETGDGSILEQTDGMCYRRGNDVIIRKKSTFQKNIDDLPFPAWDLLDIDKYISVSIRMISYGKRSLPVITSRGCPYSCTFCNSFESWGRKFRMRSPANILKEIDHLIKRYRIEDVLFVDDNMTVDKTRMMKITAGLRKRNISWGLVNISSFTTDEEMLVSMKESGCTNLSISIESAVPSTLKAVRKPVNLDWSKELIKICRKLGLRCSLNFITGLPQETKEDMLQTCRFAEEVRADWNTFSVLVPYPGTDIYKHCVEKGYLDEDKLDMDHLTQRNLQIETEHWDKQWVSELTYDINIRVNFLRNYNLVEEDGKVDWVISMLKYVVANHPQHAIGFMCLGYAYNRLSQLDEGEAMLERARELFTDASVNKTFSRYLDWDERVVHFYKNWVSNANSN